MLIDKDGKIHCEDHTNTLLQGRFSVYWEGFVYGYDQPAGKPSVEAFVQAVEDQGVCKARRGLAGSYTIAVNDRITGEWLVFSDPSRSLPWYSDGAMLSTCFIDLAKAKGCTVKDLSPEAVVEFLLTGLQFGPEVLFYGIRMVESDHLVRWRDGKFQIEKDDGTVDPFEMPAPREPMEAFLNIWRKLASAIEGEKLSVDLTGGTDTRLIVGILDWLGLQFETAVSGTAEHSDIVISQQVAAAMGNRHPHHPCIHYVDPERLWQELYEVVRAVDGVADAIVSHRLFQLYMSRLSRGVTLVIGGSGGELYKDGGWWRAATFLSPGPKRAERLIRRLVDSGLIGWGLEAKPLTSFFSPKLRYLADNYKARLFQNLKNRYAPRFPEGSHRLADRLFFEYSIRAPRGFGARILPTFNPLLDVQWVHVGINLPWSQRFLHRFYRRILSQLNPRLACIPTNRAGMTLQSGRELIELLNGLRMLGRNPQKSLVPKEDPRLFVTLRENPKVARAINELRAWGIIANDVRLDQIPDRYLARLISLWITLDLIQENPKSAVNGVAR